jgi:hypothetical protein
LTNLCRSAWFQNLLFDQIYIILNLINKCNMFSNFRILLNHHIPNTYYLHKSPFSGNPRKQWLVDLRQSEGATLKTKTMTCIFFQTKYFYLRISNKDFLGTKDSLLFSQIKKMPGKVDKIARCEPMLWTISIFVRFHVAARPTRCYLKTKWLCLWWALNSI